VYTLFIYYFRRGRFDNAKARQTNGNPVNRLFVQTIPEAKGLKDKKWSPPDCFLFCFGFSRVSVCWPGPKNVGRHAVGKRPICMRSDDGETGREWKRIFSSSRIKHARTIERHTVYTLCRPDGVRQYIIVVTKSIRSVPVFTKPRPFVGNRINCPPPPPPRRRIETPKTHPLVCASESAHRY